MEQVKPIVLIVDDEQRSFASLLTLISPESYKAVWASDERTGLQKLEAIGTQVRVVIVDLKSSGMGGGGFLQQARRIAPQAAFLITGPLGPFVYKQGVFYEYFGPSLKREINTILCSLTHPLGAKSGEASNRQAVETVPKRRLGEIIGQSKGINQVYGLIENLRDSVSTVLIQGESGTGKELIARTLHHTSPCKNGPFVAINCGAIPPTLVESELFGHERGAFTSAVCRHRGKFEVADGGTLFLDEIAELGKDMQVKLLRALQEREFQRVGGNRTQRVNVRVIAATSRDLKTSVDQGYFRQELYYRLNVIPITIPPLRDRRGDIPVLLDHFFRKLAAETGRAAPSLTKEARDALFRYSYPGNVRELINILERILIVGPRETVALEDLPLEIQQDRLELQQSQTVLGELPDDGVRLRDVEKELILKTLQKTAGNKLAAAKMLGITRRLLYLRLGQYGHC